MDVKSAEKIAQDLDQMWATARDVFGRGSLANKFGELYGAVIAEIADMKECECQHR